jgi:hypothetical protein
MPLSRNTRPISYVIDKELGVVMATWRGDITAADLKRHWERFFTNAEVLAVGRSVADVRDANFQFTGRELSNLVSEVVIPLLNGRSWRTAIVVARPAQFGVSKQFQVYAQLFSTDKIFYDLDAALRWITE